MQYIISNIFGVQECNGNTYKVPQINGWPDSDYLPCIAVTSLADKHSDHVLEQVSVSSVNKAFNKREEAKYNL